MKRLLKEDVTRRFMKLANIDTLSEDFMDKTTVEEGNNAGKQDRTDIANIVPDAGQLKEEEEVTEDNEVTEAAEVTEEDNDVTEGAQAEVTEEGQINEMPEEEPVDDAPVDDVPLDDVPMDDEPAPSGDLDVTSIVQAVTDALAQELESQGHPVDIDVAGEDDAVPVDEPDMGGLPGEELPPEEPGAEEEEPVLEDFESAGITVEEELDEEFLNEITKNVAQRLLSLSRGSK